MSAFSHAILYTLLLGASVITGLFSYEGRTSLNTQGLEALEIVEAYAESSPLEEVEIAVEREEYRTDEIAVELILENGEKMKMGLEEYVAGVLLAEMPSWYSEEALKAAAVAVRTYTVYKLEASGHICTRPSHCQAFYTFEDACNLWGEKSAREVYEKMLSATKSTEGEILLYDGAPILAVYHASSYLYTRPSSEVFGGDRAYLVSVSVPFEDEGATRVQEKRISKQALQSALEASGEVEAVWDESRCVGLRVGDKTFASSDIRSLFGLSSASFEVSADGEDYVFKTYGYGHGVGLSQSGAGILAERGWSYFEILFHYYKNTKLAILKNNE
ncbi:MAG: SpoIID/LytB domain-containing protein [Clostridia bacterium]|nr:SpoIID/LytB domain-containing protein [Clostridia bacterium]